MKYIYSLLFMLFLYTTASSQFYIGAGYALGLPQLEMAKNINALHSLSMDVTYRLPGKLSRLQAGIDLSWGTYSNERKEQTFNLGGYDTRTWVNYSSNVSQVGITGKFLMVENKMINPYISGRAGLSVFYSNVYIEDPQDPHGCRALDQKNIIRDNTMSAAYGGGIILDWMIFNKRNRGKHFIDIGVNSVRGGNVDYINTKKIFDPANPPASTNGKPLTARFINASTQEIHEHQVAEVFTTPMRLLEFRLRAVFALGN